MMPGYYSYNYIYIDIIICRFTEHANLVSGKASILHASQNQLVQNVPLYFLYFFH